MDDTTSSEIRFCYLESPIGRIRISGSADWISEVHFLEDKELSSLSPESDPAFDLIINCREQLSAYFKGNSRQFDIRLNQRGTEFQQKVWNQLAVIQYGDTINYLALAKQLGDAKVIRAAASANGKNSIAIIVPCHRVIGSNGDLVGYAGGLWRKRWLLEHEKQFARGVRTLF